MSRLFLLCRRLTIRNLLAMILSLLLMYLIFCGVRSYFVGDDFTFWWRTHGVKGTTEHNLYFVSRKGLFCVSYGVYRPTYPVIDRTTWHPPRYKHHSHPADVVYVVTAAEEPTHTWYNRFGFYWRADGHPMFIRSAVPFWFLAFLSAIYPIQRLRGILLRRRR